MSIKPQVFDALVSACTVAHKAKPHRISQVVAITLAVVRELPDELTIGELRDELEIGNREHDHVG